LTLGEHFRWISFRDHLVIEDERGPKRPEPLASRTALSYRQEDATLWTLARTALYEVGDCFLWPNDREFFRWCSREVALPLPYDWCLPRAASSQDAIYRHPHFSIKGYQCSGWDSVHFVYLPTVEKKLNFIPFLR